MVGHFRGRVSRHLGHLLGCWVLDFGDFSPFPPAGVHYLIPQKGRLRLWPWSGAPGCFAGVWLLPGLVVGIYRTPPLPPLPELGFLEDRRPHYVVTSRTGYSRANVVMYEVSPGRPIPTLWLFLLCSWQTVIPSLTRYSDLKSLNPEIAFFF